MMASARLMSDSGDKVLKISSSSSLRIQRGDITKRSINGTSDAIVNAANQVMLGGGEVDGGRHKLNPSQAIHRAAGPELRAACYDVPEVRPGIRCPKGEARITPPFKLLVSHVIHTVGLIYDIDNNPEKLHKACKESNIDFVVFPAISSGLWPTAAIIAICTVMESDGDFKEITCIMFSLKMTYTMLGWRRRMYCFSCCLHPTEQQHQRYFRRVLYVRVTFRSHLTQLHYPPAYPPLQFSQSGRSMVNAANERMLGAGGVDGGKHTVGPIYDIDNHPEVILRNAYRNCIRPAEESNIDYIIFLPYLVPFIGKFPMST
ncbi:hypothetical protein C5167_024807 [Papaver somniferum]|uniref:Macro domain-containing protein n=1 Tax=Papaver somniferum TaxID=3469 RepID=A0A4Y7JTB8_PAPSO|nr:hypothetical protein C5167_024807 [Papaver somniferum]